MPDQAEPGHIRAPMHVEREHRLTRRAVEHEHRFDGRLDIRFLGIASLQRRRNHARANPFRKHQRIAGPRSGIRLDPFRMDGPGDRVPKFDLVVGDAVAAQQRRTRLVNLLGAALHGFEPDRPSRR